MSPIVITHLPESDSLKKTMEKSCESLCGHVQREATAYKAITSEKDSDAKQEKTKEVHIYTKHLVLDQTYYPACACAGVE